MKAASSLMIVWLGCLSFAQGAPQTPQEKPAADAQQFFALGLEAARKQDFESALVQFTRARMADPGNLDAVLNLGLAESSVPGLEVAAISSFEAYLDANPAAQNRSQVRQQVAALQARVHSRMHNLAESALQMATEYTSGSDRMAALSDVAEMKAYAGEVEEAKHLAEQLPTETKEATLSWIGSVQSEDMRTHCDNYLRKEDRFPPSPFQPGPWPPDFRRKRNEAWISFNQQQADTLYFDLATYLRKLSKEGNAGQSIEKMHDVAHNLNLTMRNIQELLLLEAINSSQAAQAYERNGDIEHAIQYYDRSVQLCPNYFTVWRYGGNAFAERGRTMLSGGNYDAAIEDFGQCILRKKHCRSLEADAQSKCLDGNDDDSECRFDRGAAYFLKGDYQSAVADLDQSSDWHAWVWSYLAKSRIGLQSKLAVPDGELSPSMQAALDGDAHSRWELEVWELYEGTLDDKKLVAEFENPDPDAALQQALSGGHPGECEAFFYLAENAMLHNQKKEATQYLLKEMEATANCRDDLEFLAASAELTRLLQPSPRPALPAKRAGTER